MKLSIIVQHQMRLNMISKKEMEEQWRLLHFFSISMRFLLYKAYLTWYQHVFGYLLCFA